MKKLFLSLAIIIFFTFTSIAYAEKYIVFFAQNADIPQPVLNAINNSQRFCLVIGVDPHKQLPADIEELISIGKIEPSLTFTPEPLFPAFVSVSNSALIKDYISSNINAFNENIGRRDFGVFLRNSDVSADVLKQFSDQKLVWTNVSNIKQNVSAARVAQINTFTVLVDMPTDTSDAFRWLQARANNNQVFAVLLTQKHLQNSNFMISLIRLFDSNENVFPATPFYLSRMQPDLFKTSGGITFENYSLSNELSKRLKEASDVVTRYRKTENYSPVVYQNALDELIYLCSKNFLASVSYSTENENFVTAYSNIYRLLNERSPVVFREQVKNEPPTIMIEGSQNAEVIDNGIKIESRGSITSVSVTGGANSVDIDLAFSKNSWPSDISYVDVYIDMNNLENVGSTSMIGNNGYLSPSSGWEYAIRIEKNRAILYRGSSSGSRQVATFNVSASGHVSIPKSYINGNPRNWGVQAVALQRVSSNEKIVDFLYSNQEDKKKILTSRTITLPAVRVAR